MIRFLGKQTLGVILGTMMGLFLGAVLWAKAAPQKQEVPEVLRAQRFEVVDKQGRTQAAFGLVPVTPEEAKYLGSGDTEESVGLMLSLQTVQNQKDPEAVAGLAVSSSGKAGLILANYKKRGMVMLGVDKDGNMGFRFIDKHGKTRIIEP